MPCLALPCLVPFSWLRVGGYEQPSPVSIIRGSRALPKRASCPCPDFIHLSLVRPSSYSSAGRPSIHDVRARVQMYLLNYNFQKNQDYHLKDFPFDHIKNFNHFFSIIRKMYLSFLLESIISQTFLLSHLSHYLTIPCYQ